MSCHQHGRFQRLAARGLVLVGVFSFAITALATEPTRGIVAMPQEGFNLMVSELMTPTYAVVKLATPNHGWFAGTFTQLPTGQPVTFGLSMDGQDDSEPANVLKWKGLHPVMTYADPQYYESYLGYTKGPNGHWIADDPFLVAVDRNAGTGKTPVQQIVPTAAAEQFLSADGTTWYPWREITSTQTMTGLNIFRMTETFIRPTATLAMRVPYHSEYQQTMLDRLQDAKRPGVFIDQLGQTPGGHALSVVRLEPPDLANAPTDSPTILVYAREHATEHDSSWVVEGLLQWLLSTDPVAQTARQQCNWLLIPLLDPDMAAQAIFTDANLFGVSNQNRPESIAYATYLVNWLDTGHRLDIAVNLHNVECAEGPNIFAPVINPTQQTAVKAFNDMLYAHATDAGFTTGTPGWCGVGMLSLRLSGWCYQRFRTFDLAYEVNSRYPAAPLLPPEERHLGEILGHQLTAWFQTPEFASQTAELKRFMDDRATKRHQWWVAQGRTPQTRTTYDLLGLGY